MADEVERPLVRFQRRAPTLEARRSGRPGGKKPADEERVQRLGPRFDALERAIAARRVEVVSEGRDAPPEHVVVFSLERANLKRFWSAMEDTALECLLDEERDGEENDQEVDDEDDEDSLTTAHICVLFRSEDAVKDLIRLWRSSPTVPLPSGFGFWRDVFDTLTDVRRWSREDRLRETGIEAIWQDLVATQTTGAFEVELWCRHHERDRSAAEARVRAQVEALGGRVLDRAVVPPIAWHALLVEIDPSIAERLLHDRAVTLLQIDEVQRFRPMTGSLLPDSDDEGEPTLVAAPDPPPAPGTLRSPIVALLDGLPMQNHAVLAGRLRIYDPRGVEPLYQVAHRRHGTGMASLITRGDLGANEPASAHELFVYPVLEPTRDGKEHAPVGRLWLDVIERAVRDTLAVAPTVRIFNLSLGDSSAPFTGSISPLARLLDWLAWELRVLFVVSAGNHTSSYECEQSLDPTSEVLQAMWDKRFGRRILSPAEGVQVLTVGAVAQDASQPHDPRADPHSNVLVQGEHFPAPYNRGGPGFRRTVKPEILMPGGREKYWRGNAGLARGPFTLKKSARPPGQCVASPPGPDTRTYNAGTSNAAALASRAAERVLDQLQSLSKTLPDEHALTRDYEALLVRTLLIHVARWIDGGSRLRSELGVAKTSPADLLGFGLVDVDRALACTRQRITLYDVGMIRPGEAWQYDLPLPPSIQSSVAARRVVVTVSWFTPIRPQHRRYRRIGIQVTSNVEDSALRVVPQGASNQHRGGTVFHRAYERARSAINLDEMPVSVTLRATMQAPPADPDLAVPYSIAVTFESEENVPVYDEIRELVQSRVLVRARATGTDRG